MVNLKIDQTEISAHFKEMQNSVTDILLKLDPKAKLTEDIWSRNPSGEKDQRKDQGKDLGEDQGGGITRIFQDGAIFERGGVNFSEVFGPITKELAEIMPGAKKDSHFYATGTSLVLHPYSPKVPTVHCNFRYMSAGTENDSIAWFGGGTDLTPYVVNEEDFRHFHNVIKTSCDRHNRSYYPDFKKWCDEYFYLPHRKESRGIGGIFYDYLGKDTPHDLNKMLEYVKDISSSFSNAYFPIVEQRKGESFSEKEKIFQLQRRGRYVEFNLLYDRGTAFGLKSMGRTESILMSLPPQASWVYDFKPEPNSEEEKLIDILKNPRDWAADSTADDTSAYSDKNSVYAHSVSAPSLNVG